MRIRNADFGAKLWIRSDLTSTQMSRLLRFTSTTLRTYSSLAAPIRYPIASSIRSYSSGKKDEKDKGGGKKPVEKGAEDGESDLDPERPDVAVSSSKAVLKPSAQAEGQPLSTLKSKPLRKKSAIIKMNSKVLSTQGPNQGGFGIVPEFFPELLAVPLTKRPLFPGFYKVRAWVFMDSRCISKIRWSFTRFRSWLPQGTHILVPQLTEPRNIPSKG